MKHKRKKNPLKDLCKNKDDVAKIFCKKTRVNKKRKAGERELLSIKYFNRMEGEEDRCKGPTSHNRPVYAAPPTAAWAPFG
jgi:hypothetical protein